jgi:hypothetical protein
MILNVVVEEQTFPIEVPDVVIDEGDSFFSKIDADMDKGWQMSRDWVDKPDTVQRCQIVGDKMLTAMHQDNQNMLVLLAGYILKRAPGIKAIRIDTNGEMLETELVMENDS